MATRSEQASSPNTSLGEGDLKVLFDALYPVRRKYMYLGLQIGVEKSEIETIEAQHNDFRDRLLEILSFRLKRTESLFWHDIDRALRSTSVNEHKEADRIRGKYGHLYSSIEDQADEKEKEIEKGKRVENNPIHLGKSDSQEELDRKVSVCEGYNQSKYEGIVQYKRKRKMKKKQKDECSDIESDTEADGEYKIQKGRKCNNQTALKNKIDSEFFTESDYECEPYTGENEGISTRKRTHETTRKNQLMRSDKRIKLEKWCKSGNKQEWQKRMEKTSPSPVKKYSKNMERRGIAQADEIVQTLESEKSLEAYPRPHVTKNDSENLLMKESKRTRTIPLEKDTLPSDSTQDEWEEESGSDDSSEDEDRDSEQKSSTEEEETEPGDESSSLMSEEEIKKRKIKEKRLRKPELERIGRYNTVKGKQKQAKLAPSMSKYDDKTDFGANSCDGGENDIKPKKKRRRRYKDGRSSPIAQSFPSASASQERLMLPVKKKSNDSSSSYFSSGSDLSDCDKIKNLSEPQTKQLVKIFKRHYGKLCFAMKNPVQVAAELQTKNLISLSMMKSILVTPESQQVKGINLVHMLYKRIKSSPGRVFVITEVLMQSKICPDIGRDLGRQIGKVCPEITASLFGSELPSPERFPTVFDRGNEYNQCENADSQAFTSAKTKGDATHSLPQASELQIYKEYLQSVYEARALAPMDKYLPTLEAPYVNLAIIKRKNGPEERDEFVKRTLHGGVDEILEAKKPIKIENLLTPENDGKPIRFVLVEGPPGIGKSTFAWEVCRRWDEMETLRDYHTVVLLKLREKWVLNATSLSDLFRYPPDPEFNKNIATVLNKSHGCNLLLVLDGFDEVSHTFHDNSAIKSILSRQLLPKCTIILTTRPSANNRLKTICQPHVDKHVEIIGFTEEERVRYITEAFRDEPELQVNFLRYMFFIPHIKSMMYIPLNCAIIAQVYYESQSSHQLAIPRTRTQLYKALTHSLLVRHMKTHKEYEYASMLPDGLSKKEMEMFKILAKFAFNSYHGCESRKVTFFKEDIPEGLVHFGFMNESTEMYASKGVEQTFSFLHLSLQEFLAAWHLADSYSIEFQVAYHRLAVEHFHCRKYEVDNREEDGLLSLLELQRPSLLEPATFLAGITGWRCQSEDDRNPWKVYLSDYTTHDPFNYRDLLCCAYEAQNSNNMFDYFASADHPGHPFHPWKKVIVGFGPNNAQFSSPFECYVLSYCLAHTSTALNLSVDINDRMGTEDISLVETFVKGLNDHCKSKAPQVKEFKVKLMLCSVEDSNTCQFWLTKAPFLSEIETFKLKTRYLNGENLYNLLKPMVKLKSLKVKVNSLIPAYIFKIYFILSPLCIPRVHESTFSSPKTPPPFYSKAVSKNFSYMDIVVHFMLKSAVRLNEVSTLVLKNISRGTMAGVHNILIHCSCLEKLTLREAKLGYDGILYVCSALRTNRNLRDIEIFDEMKLPTSTTWVISTAKTFSSVERLPLFEKTTCTEFLLELNNILQDNTTLKQMKIQSGLFNPFSTEYPYSRNSCSLQWTGLGPLQQFNVGAVGSGMSPNLRRSFSSSDLTQPQTTLLWNQSFRECHHKPEEMDFKKLFLKRKEEGKKLFSLPSFTSPDSDILQSFSHLDTRLQECLGINKLLERVKLTYNGVLLDILNYIREPPPSYEIWEMFDLESENEFICFSDSDY